MNRLQYRVSTAETGTRLLSFLKEKYSSAPSVKSLKRAIESKFCKVNDRVEVFSSKILAAGDVIELDILGFEEKSPLKIALLYEDDDLLICDKPAGIVSENEEFNRHLPFFKGHLQLVHRLDKETSGAIILAKRKEIQEKLIHAFAKRHVCKSYLAIVDGKVRQKRGAISNALAKKCTYQGQSIWGSVSKKKGLLAVTEWDLLKRTERASFLLCRPETGRTHQLRVHLSEMGHPILGDYQYGRKFSCPLEPRRHLLHAYKISFQHPRTGSLVQAEAVLPADFQKMLQMLEMRHE